MSNVSIYEMCRVKRVIQGVGSRRVLGDELRALGARRALIITGTSLGSKELFAETVSELGDLAAGIFTGVRPHNPIEVLGRLIEQARELDPDVFVGVGGGSAVDAAKMAALAALEGISNPKDLAAYAVQKGYVKPLSGVPAPVVAVPTTLSAAEWDGFAGSVDAERGVKDVMRYLELTPTIVFLDPELCAVTPRDIWAQTGVRSVDHAVEIAYARNAHPFTTHLALGALELLARYLPRSVRDAANYDAALQCQIAAWMSITGVHNVSLGLSHAIGHQLGALGVPHGVSSCIMLPHVMRFLAPATVAQQERMHKLLAEEVGIEGAQAADQIEVLFDELGVPRRISQYKVPRDKMELVAEAIMGGIVARESPVPVTKEKIIALLEAAW